MHFMHKKHQRDYIENMMPKAKKQIEIGTEGKRNGVSADEERERERERKK